MIDMIQSKIIIVDFEDKFLPLLCSMPLISPNFDVMSIFFPNSSQGAFPKTAGKSPATASQNMKVSANSD